MKAIGCTQPHAGFIVSGRQIWLTRQYKTEHRGDLAIYASKKIENEQRDICRTDPFATWVPHIMMLPRSRIVGVVELVACKMAQQVYQMEILRNFKAFGRQTDLGTWKDGWWAYEFRNPRRLLSPIECEAPRNHMWDLKPLIEDEVRDQLKHADYLRAKKTILMEQESPDPSLTALAASSEPQNPPNV